MFLRRMAVPATLAVAANALFGGVAGHAAGTTLGCGTGGLVCNSSNAYDFTKWAESDLQDNSTGPGSLGPSVAPPPTATGPLADPFHITNWSFTPDGSNLNFSLTTTGGIPFGGNLGSKLPVGFSSYEALFTFQTPAQDHIQYVNASDPGGVSGDFMPAYPTKDKMAFEVYYSWNPKTTPHSSWGFQIYTPELYWPSFACSYGDVQEGKASEPGDSGTISGQEVGGTQNCGSASYDPSVKTLNVSVPYSFPEPAVGTPSGQSYFSYGNPGDAIVGSGVQVWGTRDTLFATEQCEPDPIGCSLIPTITSVGNRVPAFLTVMDASPKWSDAGTIGRGMAFGLYRRVGNYENPAACGAGWSYNFWVASNYGYGGVGLAPQAQNTSGCFVQNPVGRHYNFFSAFNDTL